jgi:Ulp1 family protease
VLEGDEHHAVVRDRGKTSSGRTLNLSRESTGTSPDSGEEKMPIPIDGSGTGKRESVVIIENTQDELGRSKSLVDASASFSLQEEKTNERMETRKRAAASQREDERLKRRRIETRRNEVLLTYPYDGSDTAGRISVTLGDVDRLVPGEFLNDNIIDFYLR